MEKDNISYQKVPPDNHRANIAERCIETGKHHIISILAGTDDAFPINQWDRLITQAKWMLNMLRPCRLNPKLSAYTYMEGHHDSITSPSSPWDGTPWYLKTQSDEHRGHIMASKVSPLGPPLNTIVAPHADSNRLAPRESPTPS
ncbi:hypothetical protein ACHAWF_012099 [Thalassiosira exigua]